MRIIVTYFPLITAGISWSIGRWMPADTVQLYAVQAVLLSGLPWWILIGVIWLLIQGLYRKDRRYLFAISLLGLLGIPFQLGPSQPSGLQVAAVNVNAFTGHSEVLSTELSQWDADVLFVIEKRVSEIEGMIRVADDFQTEVPRPSHHMAIFCHPDLNCSAYVSPQVGSATMAMSYGLVRIKDICIVGIHAPPPIPKDTTGMAPYLDELSDFIGAGFIKEDKGVCHTHDRVLMMGDLNAVPHSEPYHRLQNLGLIDRQAYSGLWRLSWPTGGGWINFPLFRLDHIFTGPEVPISHEQIRVSNSDHKGLRVWLLND